MINPTKTERYTFRMTTQERQQLDYACRCLQCDRTTLLRALINRVEGMSFEEDELIPLPVGMAAAGSKTAAEHGRLGMASRWKPNRKRSAKKKSTRKTGRKNGSKKKAVRRTKKKASRKARR